MIQRQFGNKLVRGNKSIFCLDNGKSTCIFIQKNLIYSKITGVFFLKLISASLGNLDLFQNQISSHISKIQEFNI